MRKITFTDEESAKIINLYISGTSCKQIGKLFNCSKQTINLLLRDNDVALRDISHCQQKYSIDENVFEKIDSHEKAYWLGMISGDGCVTKRGELTFSLQEKDKIYVEKFKEFLKAEHPVTIVSNRDKKDGSPSISHCFYVSNKKLVEDLNKLSIVPNKTYGMEFPPIKDEFLSSYMLGLIDSDGSFCLKSKYNKKDIKTLSFSFIGPIKFVEKFQEILINKCNVSKTKLDTQNSDIVRVLNYGGYKHIFSIVKFLYSHSPVWMERKKSIAINYLLTKCPEDEWLKSHSK